MRYVDLFASVPLWLLAGTAYAQPQCGAAGVPPNSTICRPYSNAPQPTDIVGGAMANGPNGANTEVKFPISALGSAGFASIATQNRCAVTGMAAAINCGAAAAGSVAVSAGTSSVTLVSSTVVTANSSIQLTVDQSLSTLLGVTCNSATTSGSLVAVVSARASGASFSIEVPGVTTTNPVCVNYLIIN
jgi:hypothetical protein